MALAPGHRFGQIIGVLFEAAVLESLQRFADNNDLYLDKKGPRPARSGKNVTLTDRYGNQHNLDFVLERGGTASQKGMPVAFIEVAWRRYTKHSKNKVQEIEGAVEPLAETYSHLAPFKGAILSGDFTAPAISQLRSRGYSVLYLRTEDVVAAFRSVGIDAATHEDTSDGETATRLRAWEALSLDDRTAVATAIMSADTQGVNEFMENLRRSLTRQIVTVWVLPLHGTRSTLDSVGEAIAFVESYNEESSPGQFTRFEIEVRYNNDDVIRGSFAEKTEAIMFLRTYESL